MQYVTKTLNTVTQTWSSLNPATLSGAIDIIVVQHPDGSLSCSPFHVRFGKFQLLVPGQKKVEVTVNDKLTDIPMKVSGGGEAFFVFEVAEGEDIPAGMGTSPITSPKMTPDIGEEPSFLDINAPQSPETKVPSTLHTKKDDSNDASVLDTAGYNPTKVMIESSEEKMRQIIQDELGTEYETLIPDESPGSPGSPRSSGSSPSSSPPTSPPQSPVSSYSNLSDKKYVKTLRLTSEQLQALDLKPGQNNITYRVQNSVIPACIYLWESDVPIVISDIDGTITKSDAMGHMMALVGRDWTHAGVARLFHDIHRNGYNIMYLTARSVGQADSTRAYLNGVNQDAVRLPKGPVILSPDRTMAALRREVILKKPEVFKMACLGDLRSLYFPIETPFYAGFGNRITDAISYRSVGIPSSKIFTINPEGEVHLELLELSGTVSSYLRIHELVDHFFPPVGWDISNEPRSPAVAAMDYNDVSYWREPLPPLSDEEDEPPKSPTRSLLSPVSSPRSTVAQLVTPTTNHDTMLSKVTSQFDKNAKLDDVRKVVRSDSNEGLGDDDEFDEDGYDEEADEDYIPDDEFDEDEFTEDEFDEDEFTDGEDHLPADIEKLRSGVSKI